jgi:hypothetical protein
MDGQGLQFLESQLWAYACLRFWTTDAHIHPPGTKRCENSSLDLIGAPKGAHSGPDGVDSLGHQHDNFAFDQGHKLPCGIRETSPGICAYLLQPTEFCCVAPGGGGATTTTLSTLALTVVPLGMLLSGQKWKFGPSNHFRNTRYHSMCIGNGVDGSRFFSLFVDYLTIFQKSRGGGGAQDMLPQSIIMRQYGLSEVIPTITRGKRVMKKMAKCT